MDLKSLAENLHQENNFQKSAAFEDYASEYKTRVQEAVVKKDS